MTTIDHGSWVRYTPATTRADAPSGAMFARRESDGTDWYDYLKDKPFDDGNVIIAAYWNENQNSYVTGPATYDPTAMFPQGCIVHEVTDYSGSDPQTDLGTKRFDPATGEFSDLEPLPPQTRAPDDPVMQALAAIQNRLDALENK